MNKEQLWRTSKYEVLAHNEASYRHIQKNHQRWDVEQLIDAIEQTKKQLPTTGSVTNSYEHMWGYFKKKANQAEKEETFELLRQFQQGEIEALALWNWLRSLAEKYEVSYLLESTILQQK